MLCPLSGAGVSDTRPLPCLIVSHSLSLSLNRRRRILNPSIKQWAAGMIAVKLRGEETAGKSSSLFVSNSSSLSYVEYEFLATKPLAPLSSSRRLVSLAVWPFLKISEAQAAGSSPPVTRRERVCSRGENRHVRGRFVIADWLGCYEGSRSWP